MRKIWNLAFVLAALFLGLFVYSIYKQARNTDIFKSPQIGTEIANFKLYDINGESVSSDQLKQDASKIKIINIFASWCRVCRNSNDFLISISKNTKIPIYGFAYNDKKNELLRYLKYDKNPYEKVILINDFDLITKSLEIKYIPVSFIIDENNIILARINGPINFSNFNYFLDQYNKKNLVGKN
ncbi:MAG: redoxin domain-containing protein [Rickettsiales bacterium]|nr:redoxin domain-containing protein [Rickettsiales bacterium]